MEELLCIKIPFLIVLEIEVLNKFEILEQGNGHWLLLVVISWDQPAEEIVLYTCTPPLELSYSGQVTHGVAYNPAVEDHAK